MAKKNLSPEVKKLYDISLLQKQVEMQRARIGTLEQELLKRMSEMQEQVDYWKAQAGVEGDVGF